MHSFGDGEEQSSLPGQDENRGVVFHLLFIMAARKRRFFLFVLSVGILAAIVSYLLPNIYEANTKILLPQQAPSLASALTGSSLAGLAGGAKDLTSALKNPADVYVAMLQSRTVADSILDRFQLQSIYHSKRRMDARKTLAGNVIITSDKGGIISITVHDKDAARSAQIANGFVEELGKMNQRLAVTEAGQRRLFYEKQLEGEREALAQAEAALVHTQQSSRLISPESQTKALMEGISKLHEALADKQTQLRAAQLAATDRNAGVMRLEAEIASLRDQIAQYEDSSSKRGSVLPSGDLPEAGLEYFRAEREVKYHAALMEILLRQFEAAKLDESREAATIQVLDLALQPEFKVKPVRKLIVLIACAAAGLLFVFWTMLVEAVRQARLRPDLACKMDLLVHGWLGRYGQILLRKS